MQYQGAPSGSFSATAAGTNSGATATEAAATGKVHVITRVSGHTDATSIIQALDGATVAGEWKVAPNYFNIPCHIPITPGAAAGGKIATSTADCQANLEGYTI